MITKFRHLERYPLWFEIAPLAITAAIMAVQRFLFTYVITYLSFTIGICITSLFLPLKHPHWAIMKIGLPAVLIMMCGGLLFSIWIAASTTPTIVNVGLSVLTPAILLPTTCLLLGLVSLTTNTSWSTVGLPMMGIGHDIGALTVLYALFAIFCWLSPLFGILCALTGWFALKTTLVSKAELLLQKQAESLISGYRNMPKITSLA